MMLKEAHASTLNNEELQPPPLRVHTNATAAGVSPRTSILGTLTGLVRECVNIPGYISYRIGQIVGSNEPDPSQACAALAKVPQAAADALVEATQGVAEDLGRIGKIAVFAAIPVGAEAKAGSSGENGRGQQRHSDRRRGDRSRDRVSIARFAGAHRDPATHEQDPLRKGGRHRVGQGEGFSEGGHRGSLRRGGEAGLRSYH